MPTAQHHTRTHARSLTHTHAHTLHTHGSLHVSQHPSPNAQRRALRETHHFGVATKDRSSNTTHNNHRNGGATASSFGFDGQQLKSSHFPRAPHQQGPLATQRAGPPTLTSATANPRAPQRTPACTASQRHTHACARFTNKHTHTQTTVSQSHHARPHLRAVFLLRVYRGRLPLTLPSYAAAHWLGQSREMWPSWLHL